MTLKSESVQTESVTALLSWAHKQLGTKKPSTFKRGEKLRVVTFVLNLACDKGTPEQKAQAVDAGIRYRCYSQLVTFLYRSKHRFTDSQESELTKQVKEAAVDDFTDSDLSGLIALGATLKSRQLAAALADLVVTRGDFSELRRLIEAVPAIVTKKLVASVVETIGEHKKSGEYRDARCQLLESHLHQMSAAAKRKVTRFLCANGHIFLIHRDQIVVEAQFLYNLQSDLWDIFRAAAPKRRSLLQRGLDQAAIRFGLIDEVKAFAKTHRLKVSPSALRKAIQVQLEEAKDRSESHRAIPKLRDLLLAAPNEQRRVCMSLYRRSQWEFLGTLLSVKLDVESEVRLTTVEKLRGLHKYSLAAAAMATEKSAKLRSEYVASIPSLQELQDADQCRLPVTRAKITELFYQSPPTFKLGEVEDSQEAYEWVGAVAWAGVRLGSKKDFKHALKLLEPFLTEIYWAQIWSIHFASQLKQRRTFNELLTLTVAVGERYRDVSNTQSALLAILQKEPHGIKVISA